MTLLTSRGDICHPPVSFKLEAIPWLAHRYLCDGCLRGGQKGTRNSVASPTITACMAYPSQIIARGRNSHHHLLLQIPPHPGLPLPPPSARTPPFTVPICLHAMLSMGASYGHLHIQQEQYRQKMRRKEEEKKAKEEQQTKKKGGCKAKVHPNGSSESQAKASLGEVCNP